MLPDIDEKNILRLLTRAENKAYKRQLRNIPHSNFSIDYAYPPAVNFLFNKIYIDPQVNVDDEPGSYWLTLKNMVNELYQHPIFTILINFLAAQKDEKTQTYCKAKIYVYYSSLKREMDKNDVESIFYNNHHSIYVTTNNNLYNPQKVLGNIFHELTRYICEAIFNNKSNPFIKGNLEEELKLKNILINDFFISDHSSVLMMGDNILNMDSLLRNSPIDDQISKMIACVPVIMVNMHPRKGFDWLYENKPHLMNYFDKHLVPTIDLQTAQLLSSPQNSLNLAEHNNQLNSNIPPLVDEFFASNQGDFVNTSPANSSYVSSSYFNYNSSGCCSSFFVTSEKETEMHDDEITSSTNTSSLSNNSASPLLGHSSYDLDSSEPEGLLVMRRSPGYNPV